MSFKSEIEDAFGVIAPLLASKNEAYGASWEYDGLNGLPSIEPKRIYRDPSRESVG